MNKKFVQNGLEDRERELEHSKMVKNLKTIRMCALNILNEKRTKISLKNLNSDHTSHIHSYKAFYHSILKTNNVAASIMV
jgi:hypothetical protein